MPSKKFSFRFDKDYYPNSTIAIKIGPRNEVGRIRRSKEEGKFQITFMIKREPTPRLPAPFKWIRLQTLFNSLEEAKEALTGEEIFKQITERYDLYLAEL